MSKCGERIKEMREAHSWKVRDLAPMVGTSIASLSRWESGINMPKAKEIKAMAKIFNVNPVWLMGLDDVPKYVVNNTESKPIPVVGAIAAEKSKRLLYILKGTVKAPFLNLSQNLSL